MQTFAKKYKSFLKGFNLFNEGVNLSLELDEPSKSLIYKDSRELKR